MKYCFVIPHYNHHLAFAEFLPILSHLSIPCVVVDDGSEPESTLAIEKLLENYSNIYLLKHAFNRGKGAAVFTGAYYARSLGFTHMIQIDADGQHDVNDVAGFVDYSRGHPDAIVSGKPYFDESAPKLRVYGRRVTDFWVALETLSFQIKDGLCGFRIYPLTQIEKIIDKYHIGIRMDFDTEILVKAVWTEVPLHFMPTKVIYPENSVSHFHYARDNFLLVSLHVRLILGMLLRSPILVTRRIKALLATKGNK